MLSLVRSPVQLASNSTSRDRKKTQWLIFKSKSSERSLWVAQSQVTPPVKISVDGGGDTYKAAKVCVGQPL
jgi:hypothetical protein